MRKYIQIVGTVGAVLMTACGNGVKKSGWIEMPITVVMPAEADSLKVAQEQPDWKCYDQRFVFAAYDANDFRPLQKEYSYIHPEYLPSLTQNISVPEGHRFYLVVKVDLVETATGIPVSGTEYNHVDVHPADGTPLKIRLEKN